jgi:hypothetical protein
MRLWTAMEPEAFQRAGSDTHSPGADCRAARMREHCEVPAARDGWFMLVEAEMLR